jgi:hypothetical protein
MRGRWSLVMPEPLSRTLTAIEPSVRRVTQVICPPAGV